VGVPEMRDGSRVQFRDRRCFAKPQLQRRMLLPSRRGEHLMAFNDGQKMCTTSGEPVEKVRAEQTEETGQHKSYVVLCADERAKGFVRPYRDSYKHTACGSVTTMGAALSETYARDPNFYGATFCVRCNRHYQVAEFVWTLDGQQVGS
jgi:hypothetical protein